MNDEKVKNVCKVGQGQDCCRYLAVGGDGFECLKNTSIAKLLDYRVKTGTINARGDNCDGDDMPDFIKELGDILEI